MKNRSLLNIFNAICSFVTALAALLALIIVLFPQTKPSNVNYVELANAGVVDSQMFLADHYYRIGNLSESIYWYSIASQNEGKYQARAINNLSYIYLTEETFKGDEPEEYQAMKMFYTSAELGDVNAAKNLYILLIANPKELFGKDYTDMLNFAREILISNDISISAFEKYGVKWVYVETLSGETIPADDDTYKYVEVGTPKYVLLEDTFRWIHSYQVFEKYASAVEPEYIYSQIN